MNKSPRSANICHAIPRLRSRTIKPVGLAVTLGCLALGCLALTTPTNGATVTQRYKLRSPTPGVSQFFGSATAVDGQLAVVGEYFGKTNGSETGTAHLFNVATGQRLRTLRASDASYIDTFGRSVAISGGTVLVGAPGDDGASSDLNTDLGSAYLFDANTGQERFKLTAPEADMVGKFGGAAAISGNTAVVGAPFGERGAAYVFDATTGQQLRKLTPKGDVAGETLFGGAVAIDGPLAIIGNHYSHSGPARAAAWVFDVTTGQELYKFTPSDTTNRTQFGMAVDIDGLRAIVGGNDAAYVFDLATGQQLKKLTAPGAGLQESFGVGVAIEGNTALVSSVKDDAGTVHVFDVASGAWLEKFAAAGPTVRNKFAVGSSAGGGPHLAISGNTIVAGAEWDGATGFTIYGPGAAYVYELQTVPEPTAIGSLMVGLAALIRRRSSLETRRMAGDREQCFSGR